jgi:putative phage-type endonuclease
MQAGPFYIHKESFMTAIRERKGSADKLAPALKLVKTNTLSRGEWLAVRQQGIGSSDAAASVGLNPYKSQLELWLEKTGQGENLDKVDPDDETSPMYWGTLLEPIVAAHYTRRSGNKVRRINAVLQHPEHPWMLANIDREVTGAEDVQILECKTAGMSGSRLWKDGVPEYVQLQVQHQLGVTGKQAADVAVLICGNELRVHRINRDDELIARLVELEAAFWHLVQTRQAPAPDGSDSASKALQALYPRDSGATVDYSDDAAMSAAFADLVLARTALSTAEEHEARLKQRIQQVMGEATKAIFTAGEVSWKRTADGTAIDTARLNKDKPAWLSTYLVNRPGSRRFTVSP